MSVRGTAAGRCGVHRPSRGLPHAEHLVELLSGQRPVRPRDRTQYLAVKLDLIERYTIVDAKIEMLRNRVHLPWSTLLRC